MKERLSNIELLRIVAMLFVLLLHCNYTIIGSVTSKDIISVPFESFIRIFTEQLCLCCVNIFVLISGWFGIRANKKGFVSLLFQVVVLAFVIMLVLIPFKVSIPCKELFKVFYLGAYYWFIPSYILLYIFSPVLNSFIENSDYVKIKKLLICFFLLEFTLGWLFDWEHFGFGYSGISFMGLYLLSRFFNKYKDTLFITTRRKRWYIVSYLICSLIPTVITFFSLEFWNYGFNQMADTSPFVIAASVSLLLLFSKLEFKSKFVNSIAASSFSMYLIQLHPMVWPNWCYAMKYLYESIMGGEYMFLSILICILFGTICIIIDQVRICLWKIILIRMKK